MALYDNKYWLLSHIRNSFISTDDTGMCEMVMVGEKLPTQLVQALDCYPDTDESQEEDDIEHESYDIRLDMEYSVRHRSNTAARLEKMDNARKRAAKTKNINWESNQINLTENEKKEMFAKVEVTKDKSYKPKKSLLAEQLEKCVKLPKNPFIQYAKFDGSAQVGIPVRKYKIFLTMLPEEQRNYPMPIICVATAIIQELIGLICLKCSEEHGDFPLQPVTNYGLYITEEDGEVDRDFPCLGAKECIAKFNFTCLGLVEHKNVKNVSFETTECERFDTIEVSQNHGKATQEEVKQLSADMQLLKVHTSAMEAPLYQSFKVFIINKMRTRVEILLGISGEKIEIDPMQKKSSKFVLVRQKAVTYPMDSVAWCDITDTHGNKSNFRIVYSLSFGQHHEYAGTSAQPALQSSASFKHYDFESDHSTAEEVVQKINLILEIKSSLSRKEYLSTHDRKSIRRRSFHLSR